MKRTHRWIFVLALSVIALQAQDIGDVGGRLMKDSAVQAALRAAEADEPATLDYQVLLSEIPAPLFQEARRAEALKRIFEEIGLQNVRIDEAGNVLGERPGLAPRPHLVFSAHLDTVFPEGTDVKTTRKGSVIAGPGIGDDARGLAVIIGVARALNQARVQTQGSVTFVGTVGEEGLGDLRGVKHLFNAGLKDRIDRFISVDGTGLGITTVGVGSRRYRITYKGPGGHSFGAFGLPSPIHSLGRAISKISDFQVPADPKTTFTVGRIGGGTSVNSIAYEAWMEVDMRSSDVNALSGVDARFRQALDQALAEENARWGGKVNLTLDVAQVGDRPAGRTPADSPIVQAAVSVTRALGHMPNLGEGSTDSNIPMSLGIPAITVGGGGRGSGGHSLSERFDTERSWLGTQRGILLAIALTEK
ncbi:MAG: M20/M25/M40 family metallo-hydrolase [Acidobacteria bacterium]|nr:M20/M25/M40 family metallo-hydrolase [Acidobacteriota bacterium]